MKRTLILLTCVPGRSPRGGDEERGRAFYTKCSEFPSEVSFTL